MNETTKRRLRTGARWIIAILILVFIFYLVRWLTMKKLPVRVAHSTMGDLVKSTSTNGKIEPLDNFEAHAPIPTTVKRIYVASGERVPRGKLLIQLDDGEARAKEAAAAAAVRGAQANLDAVRGGGTHQQQMMLESDIEKARLDRDQAAQSLRTAEQLEKQGAASPAEVSRARQQLETSNESLKALQRQKSQPFAAADLSHAESDLAQAKEAYAAAAQVVADCNVRAPFAGIVYSLPVSQYEYVNAGTTLLQVADLTKLRVRAFFDEPEIGDLALNNPVSIVWDAKPGRTWHGHIIDLPSTIVNFGTRNVGEVLISIDDADGMLLPNVNVTVTVTTRNIENTLTVPREALRIEEGRDYVYLVKDGKLQRVEVQIGELNLTEVQILSGIGNHALVALRAVNGIPLTDGAPIRIVK